MTGFLLFAWLGLQSIDCFGFPTDTAGSNKPHYQRSQKQIRNKRVGRTMIQTKLVPISVWGGSGIRISVEQKKVIVEYACASGEIVGRLKVDARGNFAADGVHNRQRPGPIRVDDKPERQPVRFEGKILGKTMMLSVTLIKTKEVIGNFELKRDVTPRLQRCL